MIRTVVSLIVFLLAVPALAGDIAKHLQDISVTVRAGGSEGSGVLITRELKVSDSATETRKVNFIWTAGHVVDGLRSVRTVIDTKGSERKVVEFKEAQVVKELTEEGRKVGELRMDAKVVKYSDADDGEDLALLMLRKQDFVTDSAKFLLKDEPVPIGTQLFHVGSLLGQSGANSMTSGIMSQVGRVLDLGQGSGRVFDQTTATAFPGSSGGGLFLAAGEDEGRYVGMLVRGAGESFNLIVPVRRMRTWCRDIKLEWALDESVACPTLEELRDMPVEDAAIEANLKPSTVNDKEFGFLIRHGN